MNDIIGKHGKGKQQSSQCKFKDESGNTFTYIYIHTWCFCNAPFHEDHSAMKKTKNKLKYSKVHEN